MRDDLFETRLLQPFTVRWLTLLLGLPLSYAIFRYHVAAGVDWSHFPLYIANKAVALAAVFALGASYLLGKTIRVYDDAEKRLILIKFCGLVGFSFASIHGVMALLLFSPRYYPKFFLDDGKMNLTGELSMIFGVLSLWCVAVTAIASLPFMREAVGAERWQRGQRMGYVSLGLVAAHTMVMGASGWFAPERWPGMLPPISMVAFIAAVIPVLVKALSPAPPGDK